MKSIRRHRRFEKHFRLRITPNKKLSRQFEKRFTLFLQGVRDYPLDDHQLTGKLAGKRSFSISGDIRVVYQETSDAITFLDIGAHNQVY